MPGALASSAARVFWTLAIGLTFAASSAAMRSQDVARVGLRSTVTVVATDASGNPVSQGSGFYVSPNVVVTNAHVVDGAANVVVLGVGSAEAVLTRKVNRSPEHDLALLWTDSTVGAPLAMSFDPPQVGQRVYAIGSPQGLEGTVSQGVVSAVRPFAGGLLQIDAAISQGSSGGPLLDEDARCVGVVVAKHTGGEALNFAIPVAALRQLLMVNGVEARERAAGKDTLTQAEVMAPVRGAQDAIGRCLRQEVARNPDLPSRVTLLWTVTNDGRAIGFLLKDAAVRQGPLAACLQPVFARMRWPKFSGQKKNVELPLAVKK